MANINWRAEPHQSRLEPLWLVVLLAARQLIMVILLEVEPRPLDLIRAILLTSSILELTVTLTGQGPLQQAAPPTHLL
jgi:hypothetical protein